MIQETNLQTRLANWKIADESQLTVPVNDQWQVEILANRSDELGCRVLQMAVTRTEKKDLASPADWANSLCQETNGPLRNLKVVEVDGHRQQALLRTELPQDLGNTYSYYEVNLTAMNQAIVKRFAVDSVINGKRHATPFVLTHEQVFEMVNHLTDATAVAK